MFKYAICTQGAKLRLDQICYKTGQFGLVGSGMAYLFCFGLVRQGLANFASITVAAHCCAIFLCYLGCEMTPITEII